MKEKIFQKIYLVYVIKQPVKFYYNEKYNHKIFFCLTDDFHIWKWCSAIRKL